MLKNQSGITLVELIFALGLSALVFALAVTQLKYLTGYFASMKAETAAATELAQALNTFESYFQTKWKGGLFECLATPTIGNDSYCVLRADCENMAPGGYSKCRSIAIIRGDPMDPTTNPDRINIATRCETAPSGRGLNLKLDESVCGRDCSVGQYPVLSFERTKADGSRRTLTFPGGNQGSSSRNLRHDGVRGMELCISKSPGSQMVKVDLQAYFLHQEDVRRTARHSSLSETTTTNSNLQILP